MQYLARLVFAVVANLILVDRLIQLTLLAEDTNLTEETFHAKRTGLIDKDRHDTWTQARIAQQDGQEANISLRGRDFAAFCGGVQHRLKC